MTTFTPHQHSALKAVADWLKAKPGKNGTPPVFRLFGYAGTGKTTLGAAHRRRRRRRGEIRGLHRQGRARHAQQGLRRRLHHPFADLSRARVRRRAAELRALGRRAGVESQTDRDRRMLHGRCRDGPRPALLRMPAAGARRSRAAAADPGRRLLHRPRARRDADRGASPGRGRSDRADVDGRARRPRARHRPLWRERGGVALASSIRTA